MQRKKRLRREKRLETLVREGRLEAQVRGQSEQRLEAWLRGVDAGCPVPIFSYFFLFFEPIPIFSYFLTKTSYFSYFLAGEAKICNKIENGIIVECVL